MKRDTEELRITWAARGSRPRGREERPSILYAATRKRPLSAASRAVARLQQGQLGPYETRYDVRHGYALERTIVRP